MSSSRSTRALRGVVAAAFSTFVALFSHILGGGMMPGPLGIVVPLVFSAFICVLLVGRRLTLIRLTLSVVASQFLFHTLFVLGTAQNMMSSTTMSGHAMMDAPIVIDAAAMPMSHGANAGPEMWFAHGVAAVITVALLHWAETVLATIATVKGCVLRRLVPVVPAVVSLPFGQTRTSVYGHILSVCPLGVYPATVALRGPPTLRVV